MLGSMDWGTLLSEYGYLAVLIGTLIGGQSIVIVAGFLAQQGYLNPTAIVACAVLGSLTCNQGLFFLARLKGQGLLGRFPRLKGKIDQFGRKVRRHETLLMLTFPFLYGFRNLTPLVLGLARTSPKTFFPLNAIAVFLWATAAVAAGFFFSLGMETALEDASHYELYAGWAIVAAALLGWKLWKRGHPKKG